MKHAGWFRLLLRVVGIVLVAYSAQYFVGLVIIVLQRLRDGLFDSHIEFDLWLILSYISPALQLALGLYLFINPAWLMRASIADLQHHCPACWYDLRASPHVPNCPECGVRLPTRDPEPPESPEPPAPLAGPATDSPKPPSTDPAP